MNRSKVNLYGGFGLGMNVAKILSQTKKLSILRKNRLRKRIQYTLIVSIYEQV